MVCHSVRCGWVGTLIYNHTWLPIEKLLDKATKKMILTFFAGPLYAEDDVAFTVRSNDYKLRNAVVRSRQLSIDLAENLTDALAHGRQNEDRRRTDQNQ